MAETYTEPPVVGLDMNLVGEILARLPAVAAMLRHESLKSTLGYVCADPEEPEQAFVRDILTEPLSVVIDKWYGGHRNAAKLGSGLAAAAMEPGGVRPSSPLA